MKEIFLERIEVLCVSIQKLGTLPWHPHLAHQSIISPPPHQLPLEHGNLHTQVSIKANSHGFQTLACVRITWKVFIYLVPWDPNGSNLVGLRQNPIIYVLNYRKSLDLHLTNSSLRKPFFLLGKMHPWKAETISDRIYSFHSWSEHKEKDKRLLP